MKNRFVVKIPSNLSTYGLTKECFLRMLKQQKGRCAICRRPFAEVKLNIEHCNVTGVVRGLACEGCNNGIARLDHNVEFCVAAANYLIRSQLKIFPYIKPESLPVARLMEK